MKAKQAWRLGRAVARLGLVVGPLTLLSGCSNGNPDYAAVCVNKAGVRVASTDCKQAPKGQNYNPNNGRTVVVENDNSAFLWYFILWSSWSSGSYGYGSRITGGSYTAPSNSSYALNGDENDEDAIGEGGYDDDGGDDSEDDGDDDGSDALNDGDNPDDNDSDDPSAGEDNGDDGGDSGDGDSGDDGDDGGDSGGDGGGGDD